MALPHRIAKLENCDLVSALGHSGAPIFERGQIRANRIISIRITVGCRLLLILLLGLVHVARCDLTCASKVCVGGNCTDGNCTCPPSYPNCEKPSNFSCSDAPDYCLNNSTCSVTNSTISCSCKTGYVGQRCWPDKCSSSPCLHNGTCTQSENVTQCLCSPCFTGQQCQTTVTLCTQAAGAKVCLNGGVCRVSCRNNSLGTFCQCQNDWTDDTCSTPYLYCVSAIPNPCQHNGTCENLEPGYKCTCSGYQGKNCEADIDECAPNSGYCHPENRASCNNTDGSYSCTCKDGYAGNCSVPTCNTTTPLCLNNGSCDTNSTHWFCSCPPYYVGPTCATKGPCADSPCIHGNCSQTELHPGNLSFSCQCEPGWTNTTCDQDIDECSLDNPCQNGGVCINTDGSFICNCSEGWTGNTCAEDVDECSANSTICGTGVCQNRLGNFTCDCNSTGFNGSLCQFDIDECLSTPSVCTSSGTARCKNTRGSYTCECTRGWIGVRCEQQDFCFTHCDMTHANCSNLSDRANCTCFPGWKSDDCKTVDICFNTTCSAHGSCNNTSGTCSCWKNWSGSNCEIPVSDLSQVDSTSMTLSIALPIAAAAVIIIIIVVIVCFKMAKRKRATQGDYSPRRQELGGSPLDMGAVLKVPPEERLI